MANPIPKALFVLLLIIAAIVITGCAVDEEHSANKNARVINLVPPQIFTDFNRHGLLVPGEIDITDDGKIAILDFRANQLFLLDSNASLYKTAGGAGRGPGEMVRPAFMKKSDEYLFVADQGGQKIMQFDHDGNQIQSIPFEFVPDSRGITIKDGTSLFISARGENGHLAQQVYTTNDSVRNFGKAVITDYLPGDLEHEKRQLQSGEVPDMFKNRVTLEYGEGGYLYVFLDAFSRLQKFDMNGNMIWETDIHLSVNEKIFEALVNRAKESGPEGSIPTLKYITSMKAIDGDLFLLWVPVEGEPRRVVRINQDGDIAAIYLIPENEPTYFDLAVDERNERIFLTAPEKGRIYSVSLSQAEGEL